MLTAFELDQQHDDEDPDSRHVHGESRERIARTASERARSADAAEGARQATALTALDQHDQDQKEADEKQQDVEQPRKKADTEEHRKVHSDILSVQRPIPPPAGFKLEKYIIE